jgi:hypothetical protein
MNRERCLAENPVEGYRSFLQCEGEDWDEEEGSRLLNNDPAGQVHPNQISGLWLDPGDVNPEFLERRNGGSRRPSISNQPIYFLCWTEEILADRTEFAVISYDNLQFGVVHKLAQDFGFRRIRAG